MKSLKTILGDIERYFEEYGKYRDAKKTLKEYHKTPHPYNFDHIGRELLPTNIIDAQMTVQLWKIRKY